MKLSKKLIPLYFKNNDYQFKGPFPLYFDFKHFQKGLNDKNISFLKNDIKKYKLKYRLLDNKEKENIHTKIKKILKQKIIKSGSKRIKVWEIGWEQNSKFFKKNNSLKSLIPGYYLRGRKVMRFKGRYIIPEDRLFEYKVSKIINKYLAVKYFKNIKNIYEFGCGPCHNIINLAKNFKTAKNFYGTDWVKSPEKIINNINLNKKKFSLNRHNFYYKKINMLKKINRFKIPINSACLTYGSMEQLGNKFKNFYNFLNKSSFKVIVNIEPIDNLYNLNNKFDSIAYKYHTKRGYLKNYLSFLKKRERKKKIKIIKIQKFLGSEMDDGWTFVIWKNIKTKSQK